MSSPTILTDPRVRSIPWRDLTRLTWPEVAWELSLSAPWLALSLVMAGRGLYVPAMAASFVFFLTGLRRSTTPTTRPWGSRGRPPRLVMFVLSVLMLGSMHAVRFNHLQHHRHCMGDDDVEAMSARMAPGRRSSPGPCSPCGCT